MRACEHHFHCHRPHRLSACTPNERGALAHHVFFSGFVELKVSVLYLQLISYSIRSVLMTNLSNFQLGSNRLVHHESIVCFLVHTVSTASEQTIPTTRPFSAGPLFQRAVTTSARARVLLVQPVCRVHHRLIRFGERTTTPLT